MTAKRITPEEVLSAYRDTGLLPHRHDWCDDSGSCGCPAFALWVHAGRPNDGTDNVDEVAREWLVAEYGLEYADAFTSGVDGNWNPRYLDWAERERQGHVDGADCWAAVAAEYQVREVTGG